LTTSDPTKRFSAAIQMLPLGEALHALRRDLDAPGAVQVYCFLATTEWIMDLLHQHLQHSTAAILCDSRQRITLRPLLSNYRHLHVATWASNRTMHDKTIIFPQTGIVYLTTNNLTQGSWSMSLNRTARIESNELASRLADDFQLYWKMARPLLP
jgi:phosphatidylserine/phosphatidylglycerophosphate/cardiolipin synthase-like enzyme